MRDPASIANNIGSKLNNIKEGFHTKIINSAKVQLYVSFPFSQRKYVGW
jgi:hypothetical protein